MSRSRRNLVGPFFFVKKKHFLIFLFIKNKE
uniref:Uncharacterized protein n=1 Tax=Musa acuminata subsp. malaccensis TaxID=214687 RepID=A0A804L2J7_MUSAM